MTAEQEPAGDEPQKKSSLIYLMLDGTVKRSRELIEDLAASIVFVVYVEDGVRFVLEEFGEGDLGATRASRVRMRMDGGALIFDNNENEDLIVAFSPSEWKSVYTGNAKVHD